MFRNCFEQSFICFVVLFVLGDQCQRVTSDNVHGVSKPSDLRRPGPISDGSPEPESKYSGFPNGDKRDSVIAWRNPPERGSKDERNRKHTGNDAGTDRVITNSPTDTPPHAPRLVVSRREIGFRTVPVRRTRRQMVEYYVDGPNGVIDRRPSYGGGQYHVVLDGKSHRQAAEVAAVERDVRGTSVTERIGAKQLNAFRPLVVNDDSDESEDVFFSDVKQGQNREALNLFRDRSKRNAEPPDWLQRNRHRDVISSVNDVPSSETMDRRITDHKEPGLTEQRNAEEVDPIRGGQNPSDVGHWSAEHTKTPFLRGIVQSILANETVASYLTRASRRSERTKRQILDYLVDSLNGKFDKRDTRVHRRVSSTKDGSGKRGTATAREQTEVQARDVHENDQRRHRGFDGRRSVEETVGRSVEHDSDDLEDVIKHRSDRYGSNDDYLSDSEQRRGSDDANFDVSRRHGYVIGDDRAETDDVRSFDKRRLAYDEPVPSGPQEEDFYYVEDQSNFVKREAGLAKEKLEVKNNVGEEDLQKSLRTDGEPLLPTSPPSEPTALPSQSTVPVSQEDRTLLSKELVEIMIKEINDRLQGKTGNPELQVRQPSVVEKQQDNATVPKQYDPASAVNKLNRLTSGGQRAKRRVSRGEPIHAIRRRDTKLEDDINKLGADGNAAGERVEQSRRPTDDKDADEKADDLDLTKQIVAIIIEHTVKQLRNLASAGSAAQQSQGLAEHPPTSAEHPTSSAEMPPASSEKPPASSEKPLALAEHPTSPEEKPPASSDKPPALAEQPAASEEKPPASSEKPPASTEQPLVSEEKPLASSEKPPALAEQPLFSEEKPLASSEKPPALAEQPAASEERPLASSEKPPALAEQPLVSEEKPPASTEKPPALAEKPPGLAEYPPASTEHPGGMPKSVLVPPTLIPVQGSEKTTPLTYWDVEPNPAEKSGEKLANASDEFFVNGFHFERVTYPSNAISPESTTVEPLPRRRQRRRRLVDNGNSSASADDFSSFAVKTRTGQQIVAAVETAMFCRIIRRLVEQGKLRPEAYDSLVSNNTCFKFPAPYRNRIRRSFYPGWTPPPCPLTDNSYECSYMTFPPVDTLTGATADPRCEDLTYVQSHPSVFNFYRGYVTTRIPLWVIHTYGGYTWGGIGTRVSPPTEPPKGNSEWGVVFAFVDPQRLWGMRFVETPTTMESVLSIAVYLKHSNDTENRWIPLTKPGSKEPQVIPVTTALINFTDIHTVTGILIFLQEWRGNPVLPHPVFISCSAESSLEEEESSHLSITRTSSWQSILDAIAREVKAHDITVRLGPKQ